MQTGWLDTAGKFYPCETFEHIAVAEEICGTCYIAALSADDVLMNSGWVKITRSMLGMKEQNIFWEKHLTNSQIEFLRPYFEENDENVSDVSKMRWEWELDTRSG